MAKHHGPLLIDTNVILECHRVSAWKALSGGYILETVEKCVEETQNGMQNRHPETWINEVDLKDTFQTIHAVDDRRRAEAVIFDQRSLALMPGKGIFGLMPSIDEILGSFVAPTMQLTK